MRHSTTKSLFERRDVVIVASVSCIYGLGSPETYHGMHLSVAAGDERERDDILRQLVALQYERNDYDFHRGTFRVRGDVVEIFPASDESVALRIELFGDTVEAVHRIDPLKGQILERVDRAVVYPASHYVTPAELLETAMDVDQGRADRAADLPPGPEPPARSAAARAADPVRPGDAPRDRVLPRHRELLPAPGRPAGGGDPGDPDRLPAQGRAGGDRREPRGRAAAPRDAPRRSVAQGGARRVRVPAAVGVRQPAAHVRRVHGGRRPGALRLRDPRGVRAREGRGRRGRADHPADRAHGPRHLGAPGRRAGGRPDGRDPRPRGAGGARAGDDPHQADGGGSHPVLPPDGPPGALPPLRHRHARAGRGDPGPPARQVRRHHRHQSPARGARHPRGVAGRDPRRRQGGVPPLRDLARPDVRARGAQRARRGDHVRGQGHRLDAHRARRDRAPPRAPGRLQRRARDHARVHPDRDPRRAALGRGARLLHGRGGGARRALRVHGGARRGRQAARGRDARGRRSAWTSSGRPSSATACAPSASATCPPAADTHPARSASLPGHPPAGPPASRCG